MSGNPSEKSTKEAEWQVTPLFRFVPYRVPAIEIDPHATGWNRIYVGVYCDDIEYMSRPMLAGKLTGEPYPEFLQPPFHSKGRTAELYWKAADLTGKKIQLSQPAGPMPHAGSGWMCGITHVRIVPMTEKEVADAKKEIELPPANRQLFGMLDYTDEAFWNGTIESEDDVRAIVIAIFKPGLAASTGVAMERARTTRWPSPNRRRDGRTPTKRHSANRSTAPPAGCRTSTSSAASIRSRSPSNTERRSDATSTAGFASMPTIVTPTQISGTTIPNSYVQLLSTVVDPKSKQPTPVIPYKRNPYSRCLSLAYPQVRTYYVKVFKQLASTGTHGVMIDLLRHPPIAGYEPIVCEEFKKKYGKEMETLDIYRDPLVQEHFSEYMRLFLVELRQAIGNDIDISVRTSGPNGFGLAGKKFIDAGLINTIVDGNWYSGNGPRPTIGATVEACGTKGHAYAVAETFDVEWQRQWQPIRAIRCRRKRSSRSPRYSGKGVERFGLYETTVFMRYPDLRRAIRQAAWEYEPGMMEK